MFRKYPAFFLLVYVAAGIFAADRWHPPSWFLFLVCLVAVAVGLIILNRRLKILAVLFFGLALGAFAAFHFCLRCYDPGPRHLLKVISENETCRLYGRVTDWPVLKEDRTEIKVSLDSVFTDRFHRVTGAVLVKIEDTTTALQRGDRISFHGRIYPVRAGMRHEGFDYDRYLNLRGVFGIVYLPTALDIRVSRRSPTGFFQFTDRLRDAVRESFQKNLSPTAAALAGGFLIGETRDIPKGIFQMFRDSGTFHLLAVSGSNVALVLIFFLFVLRPFNLNRYARAVVLGIVIVIFCALSYGEPSVVRASVMAALVLTARLLQRRYDLNNIIALTALIILLAEPAQLFDVGFQLSFVTAWGLIYITPRLASLFKAYHSKKWYRWLVFPAMISLVAQVCSTPIVIFYFERVPALTVLANLVIVPLVAVGVLGLLVMLTADLVLPLLGQWVGSLVNIILNMVVEILKILGGENIPVFKTSGFLHGDPAVLAILVFFLWLVLAIRALSGKQSRRAAVMVLLVFLNAGLVYGTVFGGGGNEIKLNLIKIPGGLAGVIKHDNQNHGDLIITDLVSRKYPVEEKILKPFLERAGIERVDRIFLLASPYNALDDILRLAVGCKTSQIHAPASLRASLMDARALGNLPETDAVEYVFHAGSGEEIDGPGYYPSSTGLWVVLDRARILFVNELSTETAGVMPGLREDLIVIGRKWQPSAEDWLRLHRAGFEKIICSKIEPYRPPPEEYDEICPDGILPEYIYDLDKTGYLGFTLPVR
jgi:ComEC/Rec2-related protein